MPESLGLRSRSATRQQGRWRHVAPKPTWPRALNGPASGRRRCSRRACERQSTKRKPRHRARRRARRGRQRDRRWRSPRSLRPLAGNRTREDGRALGRHGEPITPYAACCMLVSALALVQDKDTDEARRERRLRPPPASTASHRGDRRAVGVHEMGRGRIPRLGTWLAIVVCGPLVQRRGGRHDTRSLVDPASDHRNAGAR
jgi:hypothetical protein